MGILSKLAACSAQNTAQNTAQTSAAEAVPDRPTGDAPLSDEHFHTIARALSDPRRFSMLQQIASDDQLPCSRLDVQQTISPATISHHLRELQEAGLVDAVRDGRVMRLSLRRAVWQQYLLRLQQL